MTAHVSRRRCHKKAHGFGVTGISIAVSAAGSLPSVTHSVRASRELAATGTSLRPGWEHQSSARLLELPTGRIPSPALTESGTFSPSSFPCVLSSSLVPYHALTPASSENQVAIYWFFLHLISCHKVMGYPCLLHQHEPALSSF